MIGYGSGAGASGSQGKFNPPARQWGGGHRTLGNPLRSYNSQSVPPMGGPLSGAVGATPEMQGGAMLGGAVGATPGVQNNALALKLANAMGRGRYG